MSPQSIDRKEQRRKALQRKSEDREKRHKPKSRLQHKPHVEDYPETEGAINIIKKYYEGEFDE